MTKKLFLASLALIVGGASAAAAQLPTPEKAIQNAQEQFFDIKKRSLELERMKREAKRRPAARDLTTSFPAIKNDFEELQKTNEQLYRLNSSTASPDEKRVARLAAEIKKRSERLLSNLFVDDDNDEGESDAAVKPSLPAALEAAELKTLLAALDEAVGGFVHNPMFKNLNLINPDDSLKARTDLETVIAISRLVRARTRE